MDSLILLVLDLKKKFNNMSLTLGFQFFSFVLVMCDFLPKIIEIIPLYYHKRWGWLIALKKWIPS